MAPSLATQLAELDSAAPQEFDADDNFDSHIAPDADRDGREHYTEVGPSALRKLGDNELDPKYEARKISRKQLDDDADEASGSDDDASQPSVRGEGDDDEGTPAASSNGNSCSESEDDEHDTPEDEPHQQDTSSSLQKTREADVTKGRAVARQLQVWDALLDTRIRLQKALQACRKQPSITSLDPCFEIDSGKETVSRFWDAAFDLSTALFEAQEQLFEAATSSAPPARKKRKLSHDPDTTASLAADEARLRSAELSALDAAYHPHLVTTLNKWSNKIQAVSPAFFASSNANAFSKKRPSASEQRRIIELIDDTLAKRVEARTTQEQTELSWDDTDFYQQLLRDVIESRGGTAGAEPWVLNKQRRVKKVVDTKASKGRKLRYTVHEKLQHFMVPVPTGAWHEEQIDELFRGLFGRGQSAAVKQNTDADAAMRVDDGFRLFG